VELRRRGTLVPSHVCVIGVGAVTSVGIDAIMTAASVRAGVTRFAESRFVDRAGEPMVFSRVSFLPEVCRGVDRLVAIAGPSVRQALLAVSNHVRMSEPRGVVPLIGAPAPRPGWAAADAQQLVSQLVGCADATLSGREADVAPVGHVGAIAAVAKGAELITSGRAELVLAGGVDSYYDIDALEWLDETRRLHTERNADGFVPGEGAGFCLLASAVVAQQLGVRVLARIRAVSITQEPYPLVSNGVCIGTGLTEAFHSALGVLSDDERADWTLCDMNGESFRATEWTYAYVRTGKKHRDPLALWHPADCYGDIGAASGSVMIALAIGAWSRGYARGKRCLIWTSSDEGARGALLLEAA